MSGEMSEIIMILRKGGSLIVQFTFLFLMLSGSQGVSRERELLMEKNQYLLKLYEDKDLTPKEREHLENRVGDVDYFLSRKRPFIVDEVLAIFGGIAFVIWGVSFPIVNVKKKKKAKET